LLEKQITCGIVDSTTSYHTAEPIKLDLRGIWNKKGEKEKTSKI
jgi:hypothetical protein